MEEDGIIEDDIETVSTSAAGGNFPHSNGEGSGSDSDDSDDGDKNESSGNSIISIQS